MVLSSPQVTTPSDTSSSGEVLDLQSRFANVSEANQDNNDAADANLFLEDPFCLQPQTADWFIQPWQPRPSKDLLLIGCC